jgi:Icc-related predicted phosphoesterase
MALAWLTFRNKIIYLQDRAIELNGVKFYGSPWQPEFCNWAFNLSRDTGELGDKWAMIPEDTDVLITHGPPMGILDKCDHGKRVGCEELFNEVTHRVKPKIHVFGHIHEEYGTHKTDDTLFVNASTCTVMYEPTNPPIVVDLIDGKVTIT